jgi:hypothetical protein
MSKLESPVVGQPVADASQGRQPSIRLPLLGQLLPHVAIICPFCRDALSRELYCCHCGFEFRLEPPFLASIKSKTAFVMGAVGIGWAATELHRGLAIEDQWLLRLMLDVAVGVAYYQVCRRVYSLFQHVEAKRRTIKSDRE